MSCWVKAASGSSCLARYRTASRESATDAAFATRLTGGRSMADIAQQLKAL